MTALLGIYGLPIVASVVLGAGLALLGCHLAARDRALQALCVGQGAMLGVLVGLGLTTTVFSEELLFQSLPWGLAIVAAAVTYYGSEALVGARSASRSTHFAALFAALLAGGALVGAAFPALEGHLAQKYFGDLATLSEADAWLALGIGILLLGMLTWRARQVSRASFAEAILGASPGPLAEGSAFWFAVGTVLVLSVSVQVVGFLYTVACLFVPTALASRSRRPGLRRHFVACAAVAGLGSGGGFLLSLDFATLPTVPVIVALLLVFGQACVFLP